MASSASPDPRLDPGRELLDPARYARDGYPDALFKRLRDEAPVCRVSDPMVPYWAITRHRDIVDICRNPELFSNLPHFQINIDAPFGSSDDREPETIIQMDPPKHRRYRELVSHRFTPRALHAGRGRPRPDRRRGDRCARSGRARAANATSSSGSQRPFRWR